jgi:high-affinity Fe2+/Pb2+ permease
MRSFLRRAGLYFLVGFVLAFVAYLFIRFDPDKVLLGMLVGVAGGLVLTVVLFWLGRKLGDEGEAVGTQRKT